MRWTFPTSRLCPSTGGVLNHYLRDEGSLALARSTIESGRTPHAIGLQSHQPSGTRALWMFQEESDAFGRLGVRVHWTENSLLSGEPRKSHFVKGKANVPPWPCTPEGEEHQARALQEQYTLLFGHPNVDAITQWNFTDACSWLGAPSGLLDRELEPKPAYRALRTLIRRDWWSDAGEVTDGDGRLVTRLFHGDYRVRAVGGNGIPGPWLECAVDGPTCCCRIDLAPEGT